jgi:hypothetical protein
MTVASDLALPGPRAASDRLEVAKWAALALMTLNHVLLALPAPWPEIGHLAGRPCVALFSWILAVRLAEQPDGRPGRAFRRLLIWAVAAEPVYYALVGRLVIRGDILFALAAGAGLIWLVQRRRWALALAAGAALILANPWLEGGALGAFGLLAGFLSARRSTLGAAWTIAGFAVVQNLVAAPGLPWAAAAVLAAPLIITATARLPTVLPRLPGWAFYAYYPAHLLVVLLVFGAYR